LPLFLLQYQGSANDASDPGKKDDGSPICRHHHPLYPRLRIITATPFVENGDPKPAPAIAVRAAQTGIANPFVQSSKDGLIGMPH